MRRRFLVGIVAAAVALAAATGAAAAGKALLGVYYFGGWSARIDFHHDGLLSGPYSGRRPLYGWLDGRDPMRSQLYWARKTGVDFFNFLWYFEPEKVSGEDPYLNQSLTDYLATKDRQGVGFAITYTNEPSFVIPRDRWRAVAEEWVTRYFLHPDYLRISGEPVLFVLEGNSFFEQLGGNPFDGAAGDAGVNSALDELREAARAHGLPGVFVVAGRYTPADFDWGYFPEPFRGASWNAVSQYGYPALAGTGDGEHPYAELASAARAMWDRMAARAAQPYIPVVTVGWDPRPWQERIDGYLFWYTRSPADVAGLLADAIAWVGRNPGMQVTPTPLVLLPSWNELGEGMYIVPTVQDRFGYGQAIASTLGLEWNPEPRRLSVRVRGPGVVAGGGLRCNGVCSKPYEEGLVTALRARPAKGFRLAAWTGACMGRKPTCTVLMDAAKSVRATFARR